MHTSMAESPLLACAAFREGGCGAAGDSSKLGSPGAASLCLPMITDGSSCCLSAAACWFLTSMFAKIMLRSPSFEHQQLCAFSYNP